MKCNSLSHILEIARDKEVPRQFIVNDLQGLISELRDRIQKNKDERSRKGMMYFGTLIGIEEILGEKQS